MEYPTNITLMEDENEKDPLAIDTPILENNNFDEIPKRHGTLIKHSHSLRRHIPRIIVKALHPENEFKLSSASNNLASSIFGTSSTITPTISSRGTNNRRIQQQSKARASTAVPNTDKLNIPGKVKTQASTMREVLASIPGFSLKPRRRSSKKISTAAQIEQTKDGKIDLETPDSILASTNLRALLNKQTFSMLSPLYQHNLIQLLPNVDREAVEIEQKLVHSAVPMEAIRLGSSLNNEFFARACLEWRERLTEGEFTPENQTKLKTESERERNKLDPWKLKHFEPIWGEKSERRACGSKSELNIKNTEPQAIDTINRSDFNDYNLEEEKHKFESINVISAVTNSSPSNLSSAYDEIVDKWDPITENHGNFENNLNFHISSRNDSNETYENRRNNKPKLTPHKVQNSVGGNFSELQKRGMKRSSASSSCYGLKKEDILLRDEAHFLKTRTEKCNRISVTDKNTTCDLNTINLKFSTKTPTHSDVTQKQKGILSNINNDNELSNYMIQHIPSSNRKICLMTDTETQNSQMHYLDIISSNLSVREMGKSTCDSIEHMPSTKPFSDNTAIINLAVDIQTSTEDPDEDLKLQFSDVENYVLGSSEESSDNCSKEVLSASQGSDEVFDNKTLNTTSTTSSFISVPEIKTLICSVASLPHPKLQNATKEKTQLIQDGILSDSNENGLCLHVKHEWNFGDVKLENKQQNLQVNKTDICNEMNFSQETILSACGNSDMLNKVVEIKNEEKVEEHNNCIQEKNKISTIKFQEQNKNHEQEILQSEHQDQTSLELSVHNELESPNLKSNQEYFMESPNEVISDMFISGTEMEVSSSVLTNSNSNNSNSEYTACGSSSSTSIRQLQENPHQQTSHQRQLFVDSSGQIMGNYLMQQHNNIQKRQHSMPRKTQICCLPLGSQQATSFSSQQKMDHPRPALQKHFNINMNGQNFVEGSVSVQQIVPQNHQKEKSTKISSQEQTNGLSRYTCSLMPTSITQTPQMQHIQHLPNQHQQVATLQLSHTKLQSKLNPKQFNVISVPHLGFNTTATYPSGSNSHSSFDNQNLVCANSVIIKKVTENSGSIPMHLNTAKVITPSKVSTTIAQQRAVPKVSIGKGRKVSSNKLPPGAVNFERSYQICQAVIQNSPNRENLKAQLRPPSVIYSQQQKLSTSPPNVDSSNALLTAVGLKIEDSTSSQFTDIPFNALGVGRPSVYKLMGPRMGFPRKKYVHRKPSPTLIRKVFAAQSVVTPCVSKQLSYMPNPLSSNQHEYQPNGSRQLVLVPRSNVGTTDSQAPRASSAPPVSLNQNHAQSIFGISITGRGRPASVDVDTSHSLHEMQQPINNSNLAHVLQQNFSTGNIKGSYLEGLHSAATNIDETDYFVKSLASSQSSESVTDITPFVDNCRCSLNAMVICEQCGAFCHHDCVNSSKLCASCVIR